VSDNVQAKRGDPADSGRNPVGLTTNNAKDPDTTYPPITQLGPLEGAPNVLIVLVDVPHRATANWAAFHSGNCVPAGGDGRNAAMNPEPPISRQGPTRARLTPVVRPRAG
jgi:hypothetical protein